MKKMKLYNKIIQKKMSLQFEGTFFDESIIRNHKSTKSNTKS